jgi:hypothetical protein
VCGKKTVGFKTAFEPPDPVTKDCPLVKEWGSRGKLYSTTKNLLQQAQGYKTSKKNKLSTCCGGRELASYYFISTWPN